MTTRSRSHPRLASDVTRSWLSIAVPLVALFAIEIVVIALLREQAAALRTYMPAVFLTTWSLFSIVYIALTLRVFLPMDADTLMHSLRTTRPGPTRWNRAWWALNGGGALAWALSGTAITLVALVSLAVSADTASPIVVWSGVIVVIASAALVVVAFAVSHARLQAVRGGFDFPGRDKARFADFLYLSTQLSTTFGTNDVSLTDTRARRAVAIHGAISWTYSTVLVALLVAVLLRVAQ